MLALARCRVAPHSTASPQRADTFEKSHLVLAVLSLPARPPMPPNQTTSCRSPLGSRRALDCQSLECWVRALWHWDIGPLRRGRGVYVAGTPFSLPSHLCIFCCGIHSQFRPLTNRDIAKSLLFVPPSTTRRVQFAAVDYVSGTLRCLRLCVRPLPGCHQFRIISHNIAPSPPPLRVTRLGTCMYQVLPGPCYTSVCPSLLDTGVHCSIVHPVTFRPTIDYMSFDAARRTFLNTTSDAGLPQNTIEGALFAPPLTTHPLLFPAFIHGTGLSLVYHILLCRERQRVMRYLSRMIYNDLGVRVTCETTVIRLFDPIYGQIDAGAAAFCLATARPRVEGKQMRLGRKDPPFARSPRHRSSCPWGHNLHGCIIYT